MATSNTQTRFDNNFTRKFGFPKERPAGKVVESLRQSHMDFISQSPFCVMATADLAGSCDASPKGGLPGFVKILDERHLLFPDVAGNRLFQSYQNVEANPHIGLVFFYSRHQRDCSSQRNSLHCLRRTAEEDGNSTGSSKPRRKR